MAMDKPEPRTKGNMDMEKTKIRQELLDSLIAKAKGKSLTQTVKGPTDLSYAENQYLISKGISFTVDRMGNGPFLHYTQDARAHDLREAVALKRKGETTETNKAEGPPKL